MKTYWILIATTKDMISKKTNIALKIFILNVIIIRPNYLNCQRLMNESSHGLHSFYRMFSDLLSLFPKHKPIGKFHSLSLRLYTKADGLIALFNAKNLTF